MHNKIKDLREFEGLTEKEVAEYLHIDRSTYSGYETGKDMIPLKNLNALANLFHTSLDYLIGKSPTRTKILEIQEINRKKVADTLKRVRKENNLSQQKFGKSIHLSQSNIHKLENGKSLITTYYALEFVNQYNYSLDDLVGRKKNN